MTLTSAQLHALADIEDVWPSHQVVIIGATALGFFIDMRWRKTADVDLILAVDLEDFPASLATRAGWTQHHLRHHEFTSPLGAKIDLIPAGGALLKQGSISGVPVTS